MSYLTEGLWVKDHSMNMMIEIRRIEDNIAYGRSYWIYRDRRYARCIDESDKIWIINLHSWTPFKEEEIRVFRPVTNHG